MQKVLCIQNLNVLYRFNTNFQTQETNLLEVSISIGISLHYMPKQQDVFGCLAKILGCPVLREAANLEI